MSFIQNPETNNSRTIQIFGQNLLVFTAYLLTAWLGLSVPFEGAKVTLFWLPSGIAVASVYRWGTPIIPGIFLAALVINLLTGADIPTNLAIATGNSLGGWVTAYLLKRFTCDLTHLYRSSAAKSLVLSALGMTIPATVGSLALTLGQNKPIGEAYTIAKAWWMGDSLGVLLSTPLLVNLTRKNLTPFLHRPWLLLIFSLCAFIAAVVCFPLNQFNHGTALPLVFITFLFVAWAALSFGLVGGALSGLGFSFIAIWSTTHHLGPFVFDDRQVSYYLLWIYTVVMTLLNLMITAAHQEINETSSKLDAARQHQELQEQHIRDLDAALTAAAADATDQSNFFSTLLKALGHALQAEHLILGVIDQQLSQVKTHTYLFNEIVQENFTYSLPGTPCEQLVKNKYLFIGDNIDKKFPHILFFSENSISCSMGIVIKNLTATSDGVLVALSKKSRPEKPQIKALLQIFSERIANEMRRAQDQEQIFKLAYYDSLTQLPNRRLLIEKLQQAIDRSAVTQEFCAVLFIDIDHFKFLNDSRGHHIGDQLLILVAERIAQHLHKNELVARLGGDEFIVIFENLGKDSDKALKEASKRSSELRALISQPYLLLGTPHHCTVSIGVNLFCGNQRTLDELLKQADLAMYHAKDNGRNSIGIFDPLMQEQMELRAAIESDLRIALDRTDQLIPYYQLQVDSSNTVIGAELLIRWRHPEKGMTSPADFIPIAEQTGLIISLGRRVIKMACAQLLLWQKNSKLSQLKIAVNLSPMQFNEIGFVQDVLDIVRTSGIDPKLLTLELTEGSLLQNIDLSIEKMRELKNAGLGFAIDDFGIGYSSMSYLKKLPIDQLKIDQTFIRDISSDANDRAIVRTIIAMAQSLELDVLAEGVETEEQKEFLLENGCKKFQGYLFGKPLPIAEFEQGLSN